MKKGVFLIFLLVFSVFIASQVLAADIEVVSKAINDTIFPDGKASFDVTIYNNLKQDNNVLIYSALADWIIEPPIIKVGALSSQNFILEIKPTLVTTGPVSVPVTFKSVPTENIIENNFNFVIKSYYDIKKEYTPSVLLEINMDDNIDPRETIIIQIHLKNRNQLNMDDLNVVIESPLFTKEYHETLNSFEEKSSELRFNIDNYQTPGEFKLLVSLVRGNKTISSTLKSFTVTKYSEIQPTITSKTVLFKTTESIDVYNNGNYQNTQPVKLEMSFFKRLFTKSTPAYTVAHENGISYIAWSVTLASQEKTQILVSTNYRPLVIAILIIIILIIAYFIFRSPIVTLKLAKIKGSTVEGVSSLKVKLFVKNRSGKPISNIKVLDNIPKIAEFIEDESLGTLKPSKVITHHKSGTIVRWDIFKLDPYEERIISYTIKSKLQLFGEIRLPPVKITFDWKWNRERSIYSDSVKLLAYAEESEEARPKEKPKEEPLKRKVEE